MFKHNKSMPSPTIQVGAKSGCERFFLTRIEREIEQSWIASNQSGCSYSNFVSNVLEVILVLRLRHKRKADS